MPWRRQRGSPEASGQSTGEDAVPRSDRPPECHQQVGPHSLGSSSAGSAPCSGLERTRPDSRGARARGTGRVRRRRAPVACSTRTASADTPAPTLGTRLGPPHRQALHSSHDRIRRRPGHRLASGMATSRSRACGAPTAPPGCSAGGADVPLRRQRRNSACSGVSPASGDVRDHRASRFR